MTSFAKFGLWLEPDLDLVYQGGNLTGAETRPYPVHIWQEEGATDNRERPVGAVARSPGRSYCHDPVWPAPLSS